MVRAFLTRALNREGAKFNQRDWSSWLSLLHLLYATRAQTLNRGQALSG